MPAGPMSKTNNLKFKKVGGWFNDFHVFFATFLAYSLQNICKLGHVSINLPINVVQPARAGNHSINSIHWCIGKFIMIWVIENPGKLHLLNWHYNCWFSSSQTFSWYPLQWLSTMAMVHVTCWTRSSTVCRMLSSSPHHTPAICHQGK